MNSDARAIDAVKACGGLLPSADADKVNMAQVLKDGAQIIVPEKTDVPAGTLLQAEGRGLTIVFTRTKRTAAKVADDLMDRGFAAASSIRRSRQVSRPSASTPSSTSVGIVDDA